VYTYLDRFQKRLSVKVWRRAEKREPAVMGAPGE